MAKKSAGPSLLTIFGVQPEAAGDLLAKLTTREQQVAEFMAQGLNNKTIAEKLGISVKTLDVHRYTLKKKLKAGTSVDVARVVLANRIGEQLGKK